MTFYVFENLATVRLTTELATLSRQSPLKFLPEGNLQKALLRSRAQTTSDDGIHPTRRPRVGYLHSVEIKIDWQEIAL